MSIEMVRALNDRLRSTFMGGQVLLTAGVAEMEPERKVELFNKVRHFAEFDEGNDPHAEHDFGAVLVGEEKFFFKIDYYDKKLEYGSTNPADPNLTTRVLTIMRSDEY